MKALSRGPVPAAPLVSAKCPPAQLELSSEVKAYIDARLAALPKGQNPDIATVVSQLTGYEYQIQDLKRKTDFAPIKEEMSRVLKLLDTRTEEEKQRLLTARKNEIKTIMSEIQSTCRSPEPESTAEPAEGDGEAK